MFLTIIIFYLKDLANLKEYLYKILFLKNNSKKVNKIVKKNIKEEEKLNRQKIIDKNNNINNINNNIYYLVINKRKRQKRKLNNNNDYQNNQNNKKINKKEFIYEPPAYLIYDQAIKEISNANPNQKKAKRNKKDKKDRSEQKNINRKTINNDDNNNSNRAISIDNFSLNLGNKIIKLDENQIYKMAIEINSLTISELNDLKYKDALKKDNRTFCLYYLSLIKTNHIIYFSFVPFLDYNSRIIKIFLFFFNLSSNFAVNALFFNDNSMHKIYEEGGSFNFIYNIPQIIYSDIISGIIDFLIKFLALSESDFIKLKNYKYKDEKELNMVAQKIWYNIKVKFVFLFIIFAALLTLFFFYLGCFCSVYKNTQIYLIKDTIISFSTSMIYQIFIYLLPSLFRINSLKNRKKECMYNFSKILQIL